MVGHLGEDLPWFYAACDLIALASFYEGLPTVIPEAWASGRPVVAPRVTGLGELLADGGGVLAESPGSTDLARALGACRERLSAGDPEFSASALRERSEPYDWERVVDATVAVYESAREHRCASS